MPPTPPLRYTRPMRIAVLISGGVDSAVALRLLQQQGHTELTAFYLKIWLEDELAFLGDCPWEDDLRQVRAVCEGAGVPLEVLSLQTEYHETIVADAIRELRAGRTPSPDISCNTRIKFGVFLDRIGSHFDKVATGHYARLGARANQALLLRAPDPVKDQTYFLSRLRQDQLQRALFPIGHLRKAEVRALARDWNLPNATRPDSQGICFLGKVKFPEFVRFHLGTRPGPIVDITSGRTLGEHEGYWFFTIGQRQGIKLGAGPWYVVGKDITTNTLRVCHADALPTHTRNRFRLEDLHWIAGPPPVPSLSIRVRHGPAIVPCHFTTLDPDSAEVTLATPDPGIALGQSGVLYDADECLGAGTIAG